MSWNCFSKPVDVQQSQNLRAYIRASAVDVVREARRVPRTDTPANISIPCLFRSLFHDPSPVIHILLIRIFIYLRFDITDVQTHEYTTGWKLIGSFYFKRSFKNIISQLRLHVYNLRYTRPRAFLCILYIIAWCFPNLFCLKMYVLQYKKLSYYSSQLLKAPKRY